MRNIVPFKKNIQRLLPNQNQCAASLSLQLVGTFCKTRQGLVYTRESRLIGNFLKTIGNLFGN